MYCTGSIRLNLAPGQARICCRLHIVAMLFLLAVAVVLMGHSLVDAVVPSVSALAGLHFHGGFPLPAIVTIGMVPAWALPIPAHTLDLDSWIEPPTTPPPQGLLRS